MSETLFLNNTFAFCLNHLEVAPQLRAFAALSEDELRSRHPGGSPSSTPSLAPTVDTHTLEPKPACRYTPTYTQLKVISQHSAFLGVYKPYKTVCHIAVVWKYSVGTFPQKQKFELDVTAQAYDSNTFWRIEYVRHISIDPFPPEIMMSQKFIFHGICFHTQNVGQIEGFVGFTEWTVWPICDFIGA